LLSTNSTSIWVELCWTYSNRWWTYSNRWLIYWFLNPFLQWRLGFNITLKGGNGLRFSHGSLSKRTPIISQKTLFSVSRFHSLKLNVWLTLRNLNSLLNNNLASSLLVDSNHCIEYFKNAFLLLTISQFLNGFLKEVKFLVEVSDANGLVDHLPIGYSGLLVLALNKL